MTKQTGGDRRLVRAGAWLDSVGNSLFSRALMSSIVDHRTP